MSDPKAICFYCWFETDDEAYLKEWAERVGETVVKVIGEACEMSEGRVRLVAPMESSVALPIREVMPRNRDEV